MEYKYEGHSLKSGIYKITNNLNGRIYVGSAKEFKERWQSHAYSLRKQKHSNRFLQADFNKCGEEAFIFEVIEVTEEKTKEERLAIEEGYIKQYYDSGDMCYNLCNRAISREGFKPKDPEATAAKLSEHAKKMWKNPEYRESIISLHRGKVTSESTKALMRKAATGRLHTEETKAKCTEATKKRLQDPQAMQKAIDGLKLGRAVRTNKPKKIITPEEIEERRHRANAKAREKDRASRANRPRKYGGTPAISHEFISPTGELIVIESIRRFCKENGFDHSGFYDLIHGKIKQTYGYTLPVSVLTIDSNQNQ